MYLYRIVILVMLIVMVACNNKDTQSKADQTTIVITGVTIIDVKTGSLIDNQTMVVVEGEIVSILSSDNAEIPENTQVVSAKGKYAIPGLWDVHTHIQSQNELDLFFPLLIAHGVLGIRDMGGLLPSEFVTGSKRHKYVPRIVAAGPMVDGNTPEGSGDADVVDSLFERGVDLIKIQSAVPLDRLKAIAKRADDLGIHIAGHIPYVVSAMDASDAGLRTIEHYLEIYLSISENEAELREAHIALIDQEFSIRTIAFPPLEPRISSWSDEKALALFKQLIVNGTWLVPTNIDIQAWANSGKPAFWEDDRLSLLPDSWLESWRHDQHFGFRDISSSELPSYYTLLDNWYLAYLNMTRRMHDAGVGFLAGTDVSSWNFQVPGASLHDELSIFVDAGLSNLEALKTATINVADYLDQNGYDGTLSIGQKADFVLLNDNPLENIQNTNNIFGVVLNGKFIDRQELDELLDNASIVLMND